MVRMGHPAIELAVVTWGIKRMEVEKLRAEIRKLSAAREPHVLKMLKPHCEWGLLGWMVAFGASVLLGVVVAQMPNILLALQAAR